MSQLVVFIAGLLLVAESQASDLADRSSLQGFLPKHDKFITPNFNSAKPQMQDLQKIADREDKQALQKLPATGSNDPISLSIFGIGLVSFVTMLGLTLRRVLQPATIPTNSGGLGLDMPMMEMKSQDSHKISSSRVGWGQLSSQNTHPSTLCYAMETQEDLKSLAKQLNPTVGYWDPLSIGEEGTSLWNYNNERKIAWFRQAEIKHGRVAMAAFVGYCVTANGSHWPFKMTLEGGDWPTGTPPDQWDALPQASKWQIILFVGLLELFDESTPPHYTNGRKPGEFPSFKGTYIRQKGLAPLDLFDPFGFSKNASPEKKARGLRVEINNGRLAMLAVFAFMSASKAPGSVPLLVDKIPPYSGEYMVPFEGNFNLFFVSPEKPSQNTRSSTLFNALEPQEMETQDDLKSLAKQLNPTVGYWDPLSIGEEGTSLWNYNNERKIAWFRQAEIKHGRVAMAAFVGYCVQANGGHWSFKMTLGGADWPTGTPPEQWDALPQASKWQIILFVGLLEAFDESTPPHYTNGRKPGQFPSFKGTAIKEKGLVPFDLYDPFGFSKNASPEKKARGLRVEINNGRLAMLAVFAFLSASKAPGSVPLLADKIPPYSGEYMVPFEGNFNLFG